MSDTWAPITAALDAPLMPDALCLGDWETFDAAEADEDQDAAAARHRRALTTCAVCPALQRCAGWYSSLRPSRRPIGVVAGRINQPTKFRGRPRKTTADAR